MPDYRNMTDEELRAEYEREQRQVASGFVYSGGNSAPDDVARRQQYGTDTKTLAQDRAAYARYGSLPQQLGEFRSLNQRQATGGWIQQIPGIRNAYANMDADGGLAQINALGSNLQTRGVPQGQGQVSNFERELFASGVPGQQYQGPVNDAIISRMLGVYSAEGDRLAFMEAYRARNGSLDGGNEAWSRYVTENPYSVVQGGRTVPNTNRQDWRAYFGVAGTPRPAPRPAAALPPAARAQLRNGQITTFGNGQRWTLRNGQPVKVP